MHASTERIRRDLEEISRFTRPGPGINRLSFTPEHLAAVNYVRRELVAVGYEMKTTPHGNFRFRRAGSDWARPAVMSGSHLDAVPNGGRFDGVVGVVASVEVARLLSKESCRIPYEVIVFSEEEGSRFGGVLTGSRAAIGLLSREEAARLRDLQHTSFLQAVECSGADTAGWDRAVFRPGDIEAYFEMHIEQSVVLEQKGLAVGVVTGITGIKQYTVKLTGVANHAGATPMSLRHDSLTAAAECILAVESVARQEPGGSAVGTVGYLANSPNVTNVIPGETFFSVDVRDPDMDVLERLSATVVDRIQETAEKRGVAVKIMLNGETRAVDLPRRTRTALKDAARGAGVGYLEMPSGAGHDANLMALVTDVGMLFVPSVAGRSHCPEEFTSYEDIAVGTEVLYRAIKGLVC
jgi:hydantoinase/carbamoylase family amidase